MEIYILIMIFGLLFDFELFFLFVFMVGIIVVGCEEYIVDVFGVDVGFGFVSYK